MSVMNVKRATQNFSKAEQTSSLRGDGVQTVSASDQQKAFGDQDVGAVLNKIADPNWVDPSKKVRTTGDPNLGKDAFMKLMLTQMKFQDPTNPLQSHEMAAQLAQFSSLEQLSNINGTLESMRNQSSPQVNYQALALIGKTVSGDSSRLSRAAGDTVHSVNFELMGEASKVHITIKDSGGNLVRKMELGKLKKGQNTIDWNGLKDDGTAARPGDYRIAIEAQNSGGGKVFSKTTFGGKITGLNFTPQGPVLMVGSQTVKMSDVKKIESGDAQTPAADGAADAAQGKPKQGSARGDEKSLMSALPMMLKPESKTSGKSARTTADENVPPAEEEEPGNITSIPMSRELMTNLEKQIS